MEGKDEKGEKAGAKQCRAHQCDGMRKTQWAKNP